MIVNNTWKSLIGIAALAVAVATPVLAHGPSRGDNGSTNPPAPKPALMRPDTPHARGLLAQLIYPCQADCFGAAKTCNDTADSTALGCISSACSAEVTTAQTACATDPSVQACRDAVAALKTCSDSCLSTRQTSLTACRDALTTCRTACTSAQ